jgi:acetyltransferase
MARYASLKQRQDSTPVSYNDIDQSVAARLIEKTRAAGRQFMSQSDAFSLLDAYGLPVIANSEVSDVAGALAAAAEIGFPVTLKVESEDVVHKSDAGGVVLNLGTDEAVEEAFANLSRSFPDSRVFVQKYLNPGVEVMIGANRENPELGHVLAFGLGGIFVEVLKDVVFKLNPLSMEDVAAMIRGIKGYPILAGIRGQEGVDLEKIEELIGRLSILLGNHPEIEEMDLNPVFVYPRGQEPGLVDVRIKLS